MIAKDLGFQSFATDTLGAAPSNLGSQSQRPSHIVNVNQKCLEEKNNSSWKIRQATYYVINFGRYIHELIDGKLRTITFFSCENTTGLRVLLPQTWDVHE